MSSYNALNKTWGFCVLPSMPTEKKSLKDILNEERKEQLKNGIQPTIAIPKRDITDEQKPEGEKPAELEVHQPTSSDELLAYALQLEEEERYKKSFLKRGEQRTEMQKFKDNTVGVSDLLLTNTRDEGEDNIMKLLPNGWDNPWKKHDREVSGKLNSLRLACFDGIGDLSHDRVINNQVFNKVKAKLVEQGAIQTTDNYLL